MASRIRKYQYNEVARIYRAEKAVVKMAMRYHNYDPQNENIEVYQSNQAAHIRALDRACDALNRAREWHKRKKANASSTRTNR